MVGGCDLFYLTFWAKLIVRSASAVTPGEKKFNQHWYCPLLAFQWA